jgi:hypothetical protein
MLIEEEAGISPRDSYPLATGFILNPRSLTGAPPVNNCSKKIAGNDH